jgi:hypothetical protein
MFRHRWLHTSWVPRRTTARRLLSPSLPRLACLAAAGAIVACASGAGSPRENAGTSTTSAPQRSRTQITAAEIRATNATTLYEVVERLHPEWLSSRGPKTLGGGTGQMPTGVQVYIDTQAAGTVDVLRQFPLTSAALMKYYSAADAQTRFGLGNLNGVIQIIQVVSGPP